MDAYTLNIIVLIPMLAVASVIGYLVLPVIDEALGRLSDWMDARKDASRAAVTRR